MTIGNFFAHATKLLACGLFVLVLSCENVSNQTVGESDLKMRDSLVNEPEFEMLAGRWADTSGKNEFFELWEQTDRGWQGTGLVMSDGDTVFIEHLALTKNEDSWYYAARIDGQNYGESILFKNTVAEDSLYVFENPDHDFPQSIVYRFLPNGNMQIKTKGIEDDAVRTEEFYMTPVAH